METCRISFLEKGNIPEASRVLSEAMLENPNHLVFAMGYHNLPEPPIMID